MENISYFETFEKRESHFREKIHSLLPRKYSGPEVFWRDMRSIVSGLANDVPDYPISYITCNPRDCLPYSFVDDVLNATILFLPKISRNLLLEETVDTFEINSIRRQQVHTLSGGEVVRLALARNYLLAGVSTQAIISSPFTWLSKKHHSLYRLFAEAFVREGKPVSVLAMAGENDDMPYDGEIDSDMESQIIIETLRIKLSSDWKDSKEKGEWALVDDVSINIHSPCLLIGDNGAGKSLVAKALSDAVEHTGMAKIRANGYIGHSRLLFQDVVMQTLLRPFSVLTETIRFTPKRDILKTYKRLINKFVSHFKSKREPVPYIGEFGSTAKTLLEYKFMLTAIRICCSPTALILDEPDWGLTKNVGIAFVVSAIEVSHENNIPVIIISHKTWWRVIAKSHLSIKKEVVDSHGVRYKFNIQKERG